MTSENLDPMPKNPVVANFFTQMGRSEELGSGVRSLYKCSRLYTGRLPGMLGGDSFETFAPAPLSAADAGLGNADGMRMLSLSSGRVWLSKGCKVFYVTVRSGDPRCRCDP